MNIIVIGDVMIDTNHFCSTVRMAPEADIPVYKIIDTKYILGGAANVANQLNNLHCNVELISVIGDDYIGKKFEEIVTANNIRSKLFIEQQRHTTEKTRLFYNNTIVNRHDIESTHDINCIIEDKILNYIYSKNNVNIIAISDYQKGVFTLNLCTKIIEYANKNNIITFIDPKTNNYIKYKNCFCLKPNLLEAEIISGKKYIGEIIECIKETLNCKNVIVTCGENGMYLNNIQNHIYSKEKTIALDVTGSGDIVFVVIIYTYNIYKDLLKSCKIANFVAGKGILFIGNYNISINDIEEYDNEQSNIYSGMYECRPTDFTPLIYNGTPEGVPLEIQGQQLPINELNGTPLSGACPISTLHRCKHQQLVAHPITLSQDKSFMNFSVPNAHAIHYNICCGKRSDFIGQSTDSVDCLSKGLKLYQSNSIETILYDTEVDKLNEIAKNNNIVFTNGCFDIIHSAHIKLLNYAKSYSKKLGMILVIGLNSDLSIKKIKGNSRPINCQEERAELIKNLNIADYIIIFNDDTPKQILSCLQPYTLIKGGDYSIDTIIGKEYVKNIEFFNYIENKSSSITIDKIKRM